MELQEMTRNQLRDAARERGLSVAGSKSELLARIAKSDGNGKATKTRRCSIEGCNEKVDHREHTDLCAQHIYEAELENAHQDGLHEETGDRDCPMCPKLSTYERYATGKGKGHSKGGGPGRRGYMSVSQRKAVDYAVDNALPAARRLIKEEGHKTPKERREALSAVLEETMSEAAHTGKPIVVKELSDHLTWLEEEGRSDRATYIFKIAVGALKKAVEGRS